MSRFWLTLLLIGMAVAAFGQRQKYSSHVVDEGTGEAMAFVNVYVSEGRGTVTNVQGDFTIEVAGDEEVWLSFVGYERRVYRAKDLPRTVRMKELTASLNEVAVLGDAAILEQVAKKLSRDFGKYQRQDSRYFNRISVTYDGTTEMVEDFIEARSAVNLRQIKVSTGQYWGKRFDGGRMQSSLTHSNLHKLMSLGPMTRDEEIWEGYTFPFPMGCKAAYIEKHYHIKKEALTGDDGRLIYRFNLQLKEPRQPRTMSGTLYVDAETYGLLRFDGMVHGLPIALDVPDDEVQYISMDLQLHINYSQAKGYAEVEDMAFEIQQKGLDFRSTLVNVDKYDLPLTYGTSVQGNLLETIADVGVNREVEKEYAIIQRTEEEELLTETEDVPSEVAASTAKYPKERVYLHLDNTGYFKGETIWFKAYVVRTDTWQRTDLSHVLYVELLNPSGDVVERRKLPIDKGEAYGDIPVDSIMTTGFYELRAYTRYMTNWGTNACFSKVIPVFKAPKTEGDYSHPTMDHFSHNRRLPDVRKEVEDNFTTALPPLAEMVLPPVAADDSIRITTSSDYIKPCGKVELTIHAKPRSTLSVSVMDAATTVNGRRGNIRTWMMQPTDTADLAPLYSKVQPIESRLNIYGKVTPRKKGETVDDVSLTASFHNKSGQSMSGMVKTDSIGRYMFLLPDINGEWDLQLLSKKANTAEDYTIGIDRHFSPEPRKLSEEECQMIPVDTTAIWHWIEDDEPVLLSKRERVLKEVQVKARRRWTDTNMWANEQNARHASAVYYNCDEDADRYADEGMPMPTLGEWLKGKNELFGGTDTPSDVLLMKSKDFIITKENARGLTNASLDDVTMNRDFMAARDSVMAYEDWKDVYPQAVGYDLSTPSQWKKFYRDGLSYKNRPIVWVIDNQYVGITNWRLNGRYVSHWRAVCQDINLFFCDNKSNTGNLPSFLDEMKSVYISEDVEAMHRHIFCEELDRMKPVVLYCFSHRKYKNPVKGLRSTHFEGFDEPSTFPMEDYSVIPPMEDYRRTLYWNPSVKTDANGQAHIEFYNNSSCTDMYISVEGMTREGRFIVKE